VLTYQQNVVRDAELDEREREISRKELQQERDKTALANERATFYEQAFKSVTRKPGGFGCGLARVFTLGLYRCK